MTQSDLKWPSIALVIVWMSHYEFRWVKSTAIALCWGPLDLDISIYSGSVTVGGSIFLAGTADTQTRSAAQPENTCTLLRTFDCRTDNKVNDNVWSVRQKQFTWCSHISWNYLEYVPSEVTPEQHKILWDPNSSRIHLQYLSNSIQKDELSHAYFLGIGVGCKGFLEHLGLKTNAIIWHFVYTNTY